MPTRDWKQFIIFTTICNFNWFSSPIVKQRSHHSATSRVLRFSSAVLQFSIVGYFTPFFSLAQRIVSVTYNQKYNQKIRNHNPFGKHFYYISSQVLCGNWFNFTRKNVSNFFEVNKVLFEANKCINFTVTIKMIGNFRLDSKAEVIFRGI